MFSKRMLKTLFLSLFVFAVNATYAQTKVSGKVTNDQNAPLVGATVMVKGSTEKVTTNASGDYSITVPAKATTLIVSYVNFETKQVPIEGRTLVDVKLAVFISTLDSVVSIGYITQKRKDVTGSISSVKGSDVKNLATQDVAEALQGRVAGVEVVKESAEAGGSNSKITIRGVSSLSQPDPLYIIDGVRQGKGATGKAAGSNINPQDIATIDVLKDASAAAIYGAEAAGGVIIITTKKGGGQAGKPVISFNTRYGVTTPRVVKLLDKNDFVKYNRLINTKFYTNLTQEQVDAYPDFDWVDALYQNGTEENYNLSVSGKTPTINYFLSGNYNKQKGIFLDNNSEYGGIRLNSDVKISEKVKIGEQISAWTRNTAPVKTPIVATPFRTEPIAGGYSGDPEYPWSDWPDGYKGNNILAQIKTVKFQFPEYSFQGNTFLEVKLPPKYLTFKATFGYTYSTYENSIYRDAYNTATTTSTINGLYRSYGKYQQLLNAFILAYDHTYGGDHTINLLAGYEQYQNLTSSFSVDATAVGGTSYGYIPASGTQFKVTANYDPNGLVKSVFGRANYDFRKKFTATFTVRRDANYTTFGPSKQAGVFPSAAIGWQISDEPFFRKLSDKINSLKLRASYGEVGNSNIGSYGYLITYNPVGYQGFTNGGTSVALPGISQEQIANSKLQWETIKETNIGLDGEMLGGKLFFTVEFYDKRTVDMLYLAPVEPSVGLPSSYNPDGTEGPSVIKANVGDVRNRGIDIVLGYKGKVKKLNYSVSFTGNYNKNEVITLDGLGNTPFIDNGANNDYPATTNSLWYGKGLTYSGAGLAFGQFYGYKTAGIFATDEEAAKYANTQPFARAGDLHFVDMNNDGKLDNQDRTIIGNAYPKFTYGLNLTANWKSFDIAMLFNGVAGVDIYNGVAPYEMSYYDGGNVTSKVFNASFLGVGNSSGLPENGLTSQPRIGFIDGAGRFNKDPNGNYSSPSDYFVENGSYLKLKNLQIGYTLPERISNKIKCKAARFYIMGNNVFQITNYSGVDPEIGTISNVTTRGIDRVAKYPNARLYSVGLDLTF